MFCFVPFGQWQCSELIPDSVLRDYSWWGSVYIWGARDLPQVSTCTSSALPSYYLFSPTMIPFLKQSIMQVNRNHDLVVKTKESWLIIFTHILPCSLTLFRSCSCPVLSPPSFSHTHS